jgi:tagatose 6-phosphate kinase
MEKPNILTITLNPAIDICYHLEEIKLGRAVRTKNPLKSAGGKGLNVSRVIKLLGEKVVASGFLGGSSGTFIHEELCKLGIADRFVEIEGETRLCLAFIDEKNNQTEILEEGPTILEQEQVKLKKSLQAIMKEIQIIVISGSLPKSVSVELYRWIIAEAKQLGIKVILDTSEQTLMDCLSSGPFMIKPNRVELEQILGKSCLSKESIWKAMEEIQVRDIPLVIVSDGANGSYVLFENTRYKVTSAKISAVSAVGSGDSFVAGIATGLARNYPIEKTLTLGSACGAANALEAKTGFLQLEKVNKLMEQIVVKKLS